MFAWQFAKAQYTAERLGYTKFISMQNHYNLLYREEEREMLPLCQDLRVGIIPWSPLARGWLTGSRNREENSKPATPRAAADDFAQQLYGDTDLATIDALRQLARQRDLPPAQIALSWLLNRPGVTAPIIGATKTRHIDDAVAALDVTLNEQETARLEDDYTPREIRGHC